jgi:hypothetical protein
MAAEKFQPNFRRIQQPSMNGTRSTTKSRYENGNCLTVCENENAEVKTNIFKNLPSRRRVGKGTRKRPSKLGRETPKRKCSESQHVCLRENENTDFFFFQTTNDPAPRGRSPAE